jgi:hypothetical protein
VQIRSADVRRDVLEDDSVLDALARRQLHLWEGHCTNAQAQAQAG